ncbi:hypothetical protein [Austwickia sp. TVS 96-490-7B]|uniref:hypothetical protein n=1 Tax=Austwickia sp. TVS 96-490-7B TaxID=2830843 RepID=UPI001C5608D9|nr:hypothetical protein [Austwickia sp. TVS 96-490-7B]
MAHISGGGGGGGLIYGDLRRWSSTDLESAAEALASTAKRLEEQADHFEQKATPKSWEGEAAMKAATRRLDATSSLGRHVSTARRVSRALREDVKSVAAVVRGVHELDALAQAREFAIDDMGRVRDKVAPPRFVSRWDADEYTASRRKTCDEIVARRDALLPGCAGYRRPFDGRAAGRADRGWAARWGIDAGRGDEPGIAGACLAGGVGALGEVRAADRPQTGARLVAGAAGVAATVAAGGGSSPVGQPQRRAG